MEQRLIDDIESGKKKVLTRVEYILNYWSPIIALLGFLIAGIFWFSDANGRLFTDSKMKYETETNTINARQRTFDKLDERYIKRDEVQELKIEIKDLRSDIKELSKALRKY